MRRTFIALIGLVLALSLVFPAAAVPSAVVAQQNNSTATSTPVNSTPTATPSPTPTPTPTPTPSVYPESIEEIRGGPYEISDLRGNGDVPPGDDIPKAARSLGEPPMGFVSARYRDPTLMDAVMGNTGQWQQVEPSSTVERNEIQLYGSAFGEIGGEYDLVVVYWQEERARTANNNSVPYAANQTVDRKTVQIGGTGNLYTFTNVSLRAHPDSTWMVTMWLERDGERMDGAQWHFKHRSNPSQESVAIGSQADLWGWGLKNIAIPGAGSVIFGLILSQGILRRTGRGPGYGVKSWMFIVGFVGLVISIVAYYQIAVILRNFPWVIGFALGTIALAAGLTIHPSERRIGFMRRELADAITIPGGTTLSERPADGGFLDAEDAGAQAFEELTESLFLDLPEVPAVKTEEGYRIPTEGVKSFFARLFSDAAKLNLEGIATRQQVKEGRLDDIIVVDPQSERAIEHKPARVKRMLPWDAMKRDVAETGEKPSVLEKAFAAVLSIVIIVGPPIGGMMLFDFLLNIPGVGFVVGFIGTIIIAYTTEDGWIDYIPAPPHYKRAEDSLTLLQRAYSWSAEEESARKKLYRERATTASEAIERQDDERRTVTDEILGKHGVEKDDGRPQLEDGDD